MGLRGKKKDTKILLRCLCFMLCLVKAEGRERKIRKYGKEKRKYFSFEVFGYRKERN